MKGKLKEMKRLEIPGKVSLKQIYFLFMAMLLSPAVRLFAAYTAGEGKQAGWLSPIIGGIMLFLLLRVLYHFFKKNPDGCLTDLFPAILGKPLGKFMLGIYFISITLLNCLYVQYYAERMTMSIYPEMDLHYFVIILIALTAYIIRSGLVVLARMNEIFFPMIIFIFYLIVILIYPSVKWTNLTPISYLEIVPIFRGSQALLATFSYIFIFFFLGHKISGKEKLKSSGPVISLFVTLSSIVLIAVCIGSLGYALIGRMPLPFFGAAKLISLNSILERVESLVVAMWIVSDFIAIAVFSLVSLNILKAIFGLKDSKNFIPVYFALVYYVGNMLSVNIFDLEQLSNIIFIPMNIILYVGVPFLLFGLGKLRKVV